MRRTLLASAAVAALTLSTGAVSTAEPGPNGNNTFGLCTAYFAGSENGQEQKHKAPPFQALEAAAGEAGVEAYCEENGQHPGQGNGNGNGNGRNGNGDGDGED